jgi:hypothetical protein
MEDTEEDFVRDETGHNYKARHADACLGLFQFTKQIFFSRYSVETFFFSSQYSLVTSACLIRILNAFPNLKHLGIGTETAHLTLGGVSRLEMEPCAYQSLHYVKHRFRRLSDVHIFDYKMFNLHYTEYLETMPWYCQPLEGFSQKVRFDRALNETRASKTK